MSNLFDYQIEAIKYLYDNPKSLLLIKMGGGKTRVIIELLKDLQDKNIFIVSQSNIIKNVWTNEFVKWNFNKPYKLYKSEKSLSSYKGGIALASIDISYKYIKENQNKIDALIIDESSLIKDPKTNRFKYLKNINIKRIHLLSALPTPNGLYEFFTQIYLLDKGKSLGTKYNEFLDKNYHLLEVRPYVYKPNKIREGCDIKILNSIKHLVYMAKYERKITYKIDSKSIFFNLPFLVSQIYENIIKTSHYGFLYLKDAAMKFNKLRQLVSGFVYDRDEDNTKYNVHHNERLKQLENILKNHKDTYILILYNFVSEKTEIAKRLKLLGYTYTFDIETFSSKKANILIANPISVGMGLNLQFATVMIWFSQTLSHESYFQSLGRIDRTGQNNDIYIYHILSNSTIDKHIHKLINNKIKTKDIVESFFKSTRVNSKLIS